jgi:Xaa-Pro aminopeptidase
LTGFEEPNSIFVFLPGSNPETVLFVQEKDASKETWTGFRYGPEGAKEAFKVDAAFTIDKFEVEIVKLLKNVDRLYYSMFINREVDSVILKAIENISLARSRTNKGNLTIEDSRPLIGEMRILKSAYEIDQMRKAAVASSEAHIAVMRATRPGVNERTLQSLFIFEVMKRGCAREGYGSIVASGAAATTLHYVFNDQPCKDGDLILIDAGGECNYYSADITRTYPVNGKFNVTQKRVYQKMLDLQKNLITLVKPGQTREGMQKETIAGVTDILIDEKLLKGRREDLIEKKEFFKFYPHGVSHWLGMDVHDAGLTEVKNEPRPYEPGMVLTVEPGLYIPHDMKEVPEEYRGIGIRIEDDILVTAMGQENLTVACPKEITDLESIIGKS